MVVVARVMFIYAKEVFLNNKVVKRIEKFSVIELTLTLEPQWHLSIADV